LPGRCVNNHWRKTPSAEAEETAMQCLTAVKILEQAHKYLGQLSGG
jgi:general L-amino acid transport system ATP-binding protein